MVLLQQLCALCTVCLLMTSCLTVEKKSYKITLNGSQSGTCTITYHNIVSTTDDGKDVSFKDFAELVTDYYEGTKLENEMANIRDVKKSFRVNGQELSGEFTFAFDSLSALKMFRYDAQAPLMMYFGSMNNETYESSNGTYGGEAMPVAFWPSQQKMLTLESKVTTIDTNHIPLGDQYTMWSKSRKK
jgi:hypothetical protein